MKIIARIVIVNLLMFAFYISNAQGINFQGVARSANGTILASSSISLRLSILSKSVDATPEYIEVKKVVTNAQGIFSIVVGDAVGGSTTGSFKNLDWANAPKFLKVEMDPSGGTSYINMGITRLQYVPFSFYSLGVAAENVTGILPVEKGGTGVGSLADLKTVLKLSNFDSTELSSRIELKQDRIIPGNKGNIMQSDGNKWISSSFNTNDNVFSSFKIDSSNYRFQSTSLNKLIKGKDPFIQESAMGNVALGDSTLIFTDSGYNNIAIGNKVLKNNKNGGSNIGIGVSALKENTTGSGNISIGTYALNKNTTGILNTAIGSSSLNNNTIGMFNTAIGGASLASNSTGGYNTASGWGSLMDNTTGYENTSNGFGALSKNTTGNGNTANGNSALYNNTTGSFNTAIGFNAMSTNSVYSNSTAIGNNAQISSSNQIQLGNTAVTDVKTSGAITAAGFKTPNGTSAQYLMADGTVSSGSGVSGLTLLGKIIYAKYATVSLPAEIWTANYDGTNPTKINITLPSGIILGPEYGINLSPNGQKIFFSAGPPYSGDPIKTIEASIYSCNIDGSNVIKIIDRGTRSIMLTGAY